MADLQSDRDPVEALAAEFVERLRHGEHPSAADYAARHPELADDIHELFPTIAAMERLKTPKPGRSSGRAFRGMARPERLGDFRIIREIGRGGMGIVYEAEQESLGRPVAVKVLPKSALFDPKHLQRFQREARTAAALHHTNIVPVFGVGQHDDFQYYVMQYIEGAGLDQVLARLQRTDAARRPSDFGRIAGNVFGAGTRPGNSQSDGVEGETPSDSATLGAASRPTTTFQRQETTADEVPEPAADDAPPPVADRAGPSGASYWISVARLGVQVANALDYAHGKGILHRDIKPANLIVDKQGVVWVADFGLAKALEEDRISRTGDVLGTLAYVAPEQLRGQTDRRSDVYSLGLAMYELLTMRPAFEETNRELLLKRIATDGPPRPRKVRPEIPRDLETIVLKAIAHEPGRRYQSAAELSTDLGCFLEDRPIRARRATAVERLWRWCRRNPVVAGLSATAAALLLLVAMTASIGYARTTGALAGERAQRQRAEAATEMAVEVLDRIYERFAPEQPGPAGDGTGDPWDSDEMVKPVLSEGAAAVLEDMLVFYDRLAEQSGGEASYLDKVALANRRVGDIRHQLGQLEQAKAAYGRALDLYEQLDEQSADKPHLIETATIRTELGIVVHRLGDFDEAAEAWQTALRAFEEAADTSPASPEFDRQMARTRELLEWRDNDRHPPPIGHPGISEPPPGPRGKPFGPHPHGPRGEPFGPHPHGPPGSEDGPPGHRPPLSWLLPEPPDHAEPSSRP